MSPPPSTHLEPRRPHRLGDPYEPIDVRAPPRVLLVGRLVIGVFLAGDAVWLWLLLRGDPDSNATMITMVAINLFLCLTFGLGLLLGRWPSFVVRLYGRRFLLDSLRQMHDGLGRRRPIRASLREPRTWLYDERVQMALLLAIFFVAGLVSSLS